MNGQLDEKQLKAQVQNFLLRVTFAGEYARIKEAADEGTVILSCLRLACNDAFRRVTQNVEGSKTSLETAVRDERLRQCFDQYASLKTPQEHADYLLAQEETLQQVFAGCKVVDDSSRALCFGHYQKLFNMAVKLYCCAYIYRDVLWGDREILKPYPFDQADCPLDNKILQSIDQLCQNLSASDPVGELYSQVLKKAGVGKVQRIAWSKLDKNGKYKPEVYILLQELIVKLNGGKCGLLYDFKNW